MCTATSSRPLVHTRERHADRKSLFLSAVQSIPDAPPNANTDDQESTKQRRSRRRGRRERSHADICRAKNRPMWIGAHFWDPAGVEIQSYVTCPYPKNAPPSRAPGKMSPMPPRYATAPPLPLPFPPPKPARGSGERCELPAGPGAEPQQLTLLIHFITKK